MIYPLKHHRETVCRQKWRLRSACEHLRLNLRLILFSSCLPQLTANWLPGH